MHTETFEAVKAAALAYITTAEAPTRAAFVVSTARLEGFTEAYVTSVLNVLMSVYPSALAVLA